MAVEIFPGAVQFEFPEKIAKEVIKDVEKDNRQSWTDSLVGFGRTATHIRSSSSKSLDGLRISEKVREFLYQCVKDYCSYYDLIINKDEGLEVLKYENYDKYEYHSDSYRGVDRTLSCLIYLNPGNYEGGGTHFKHFDYTINPDKPSLVLFPSNYPYLHAAQPVIKGEKYVVVTWMTDAKNNLMPESCSCAQN